MKLINTKAICRMIKLTLLAFFVLPIATRTAQATPVAITNQSFETGDLTGWSSTVSGGFESGTSVTDGQDPSSNHFNEFPQPLPSPATGDFYVAVKGLGDAVNGSTSDIFQDVGVLQADTTYQLTVAYGRGLFDGHPGGFIALLNGTDDTGTVLASESVIPFNTGGSYGNATFVDMSLSFTTGSSVSGSLTIELAGTGGFTDPTGVVGGEGAVFDNVRLDAETAAAPEPSTYALMASGLLVLLGIQRRRRNQRSG